MTFTGRKFALCGIWGLVAILALLTADNFYARSRAAGALPQDLIYLAGNKTPAADIPADKNEIIAWQGVEPRNLGGRNVSVLFRIATAPKEAATFIAIIGQDIAAWEVAGNKVVSVYIDYAYDASAQDWITLSQFLGDLRKGIDDKYAINLVINPGFLENSMDAIRNNVDLLVFDLDDAIASGQNPAGYVKALENVGYPFYLIVDKSFDPIPFYKSNMADTKFFAGFIVALANGQGT